MARAGFKTIQTHPAPEPRAYIDTSTDTPTDSREDNEASLIKLHQWASAGGDISDLLDPSVVDRLGIDAVRQWNLDQGSRKYWVDQAERSLAQAAQEGDDEEGEKDYPFENASDIHYPILTVASNSWAARAGPELVKGDKVVLVKVFEPPSDGPSPIETAKAGPQPQSPQEAQAATAQIQNDQQALQLQDAAIKAKNARGKRVAMYLNWLIFYKMDNWAGETDALLHEIPTTGSGFKKVYMGTTGLQSDYVSALRLTVHANTKSIWRCPRITQDFEAYPYEIEDRRRAGIYRDIELPNIGEDPEEPRRLIEQHRLDDLDGDGLAEPYIVTVDVDTKHVLRVEPAYTTDDIIIDEEKSKVLRIERWLPFPAFLFLPDPKGRFYGIGFGRLLASITDSVDTSINQLIDAGNAEVAGGGFIASGVRIQGSAQGGSIFQRPGEYMTVSANGPDLRGAIWERTVPHPSDVMFKLMEFLLDAAKGIASIKDVDTGDIPSTAPVGTTLAAQTQALKDFSSIYVRVRRGFAEEFQLMYRCLKRWGADRERKEYTELTGGDFDADFKGDGTDIQPVADPRVVTTMQKISRIQTTTQLAESPVGMAAGMTQAGPAQALVTEALDVLDWDRPERFIAQVTPNPLEVAKAADMAAAAQLKTADAQTKEADANLDRAKAVRESGLAALDTHALHEKADTIARHGQVEPPPEGNMTVAQPAPQAA